jgi:hypothetical protein
VNLILERERSLLEREAAAETLRAANKKAAIPRNGPDAAAPRAIE